MREDELRDIAGAARRQRKYREGTATVLRYTASLVQQMRDRIETLEQQSARLDRELQVAASERHASNAKAEQLFRHVVEIERTVRGERVTPPRFASNGLER
jgi:hypothetical protein